VTQASSSLFALFAAIGWGSADFLGGLLSRQGSVLMTLLILQVIGTPLSLAGVAVSGEQVPTRAGVFWAGLAGLAGLVGVGLLFLGLSRTRMGLVAPSAALVASTVPAIVGVATGDPLGPATLAGFAAALAAVVLVTYQPNAGPGGTTGWLDWLIVAASGVGSASFFLCIDQAHAAGSGTLWTVAVVRVTSLLVVSVIVATLYFRHVRAPIRWSASLLPAGLATAICDTRGTWSYVLASSVGLLSATVVLASLAPVVTTVLARAVLREHLAGRQALGVGLAIAGVVLINLGG
jgi:uncharacterized membrane protein